jgi:uncharacterized protein (TIGR01777 family)
MNPELFEKQSRIGAPADLLYEWHAREGAIRRLSPPWAPLQIISKTPGVEKGTRVKLKIKTGPIFSPWDAEHIESEPGRMFTDSQIKGPFKTWRHTHRFTPEGDGCILNDSIEFAMPFPLNHSRFVTSFIRKDLDRIFRYRHTVTKRDLASILSGKINRPLKVAITGASGLIGSNLSPLLTTGGHQVSTLVRRQPVPGKDEIFWNPDKGILSEKDMEGFDVVIHLAGENIGEVKWTESIKERLTASRVKGTRLLAETLSKLSKPPSVFLCASAIGYYGDTGSNDTDESAGPGTQYISRMCDEWETACEASVKAGIRTVNMRIGVVLSPEGGALSKVLTFFKTGLGSTMGAGGQFMSWISIEDTLYSMIHLIANEGIEGPVNLSAPNPVTNKEYTKILAGLLNRPAILRIPEKLIRSRFGQMGEEILLSGSRIRPARLLETGYSFIHPDITSALKEVLGV